MVGLENPLSTRICLILASYFVSNWPFAKILLTKIETCWSLTLSREAFSNHVLKVAGGTDSSTSPNIISQILFWLLSTKTHTFPNT